MTVLWLDFETKSRCNLLTRGVYNYAQDLSTEVLCMSYAFDDEKVVTWTPDKPFPDSVREHTGMIYAHNAAFERLIFWYVLQINFKLEQFYCTATQARANCAPGSLEDAGRFAGASMRKNHRGKQLIKLLSIPQEDGTFNNDPTLMAEMIQYCEDDVDAMRSVSKTWRPLSEQELEDYCVNERINDRGVLVDVDLCDSAIRYSDAETADIQALVLDITQGKVTSVRSPKMKHWVMERIGTEALKLMEKIEDGEVKYSIDKSVRANLLVLATDDPEQVPAAVADVIQCADDIWASSVAKFRRLSALSDDEDKRVRGAFVFAGGSATGRASSYGAQVHNFTRKCADDPEAVREAMVNGDTLVPRYGNRITDVLKGMLRPALIPAKGKSFVVADWSAIEARVNPWLSNAPQAEEVLNVFREGKDIYIREASGIFGCAETEVDDDKRQIGKVAILSCFTAETKVLTDNGVKAIVDVLLTDKLWDGQSWVTHQGVIQRGVKKVINVCGIFVTADHLLKVKHEWLDAKTVLTNKSILTQALATGSENLPFLGVKLLNRGCAISEWLLFNVLVAQSRIKYSYITYLKARLQGVMSVLKKHLGIGAKTISNTLRLAPMMHIADVCSTEYLRVNSGVTTQKIKTTRTMVGGVSTCMSLGETTKPLFYAMLCNLKGGISRIWSWIESMSIKVMSLTTCASSLSKITSITNGLCKKCNKESLSLKPVYDILNAGENHRFTVIANSGALIAHNCGFGGSVGAFAAMGRNYGVILPEADAKRTVVSWRRANRWAVQYWQSLEEAYTRAMRNPNVGFECGRVVYMFDGVHLWYALPSGRILCYPHARFDDEGNVTYAKASFKPKATDKEWVRARLWNGLACENITQATANDVLRYALRECDYAGLDVVLHVHDELVIETSEPEKVKAYLTEMMCASPDWCRELPLAVGIKTMSRYGK